MEVPNADLPTQQNQIPDTMTKHAEKVNTGKAPDAKQDKKSEGKKSGQTTPKGDTGKSDEHAGHDMGKMGKGGKR